MPGLLVTLAMNTRSTPVTDKGSELRPNVGSSNEFQSTVLTEVTSKNVIMLVLKNSEPKGAGIGYIDPVVKSQKAGIIY